MKVEDLPLIISILAFAATIWHFNRVRHHFKLSVTPHLNLDYDTSSKDSERGVYIENNGVGPAIITSFKVYLNEKVVIENNLGSWWDVTKTLNVGTDNIAVFKYNSNDSIPSNKRQFLYYYQNEQDKDPDYYDFYESIKSIKIVVGYKSIYGVKQKDACFEFTHT